MLGASAARVVLRSIMTARKRSIWRQPGTRITSGHANGSKLAFDIILFVT
jgi:hypothetical protein